MPNRLPRPPLFTAIVGHHLNTLRLLAAGWLLILWLSATPYRTARAQLAALPDIDYLAEAQSLRRQQRYAEALMILDAAEDDWGSGTDGGTNAILRREIEDDRKSVLRSAKNMAGGVLFGTGDSIEAVIAACASDLFVIGDVRDLVIEGSKLAIDGEADYLILFLSAIGVATPPAPQIDWVPGLLKVARRAGALSVRMTESLNRLCRKALKEWRFEPFVALANDISAITRHTSPATAIRTLRHLDDASEINAIARFARRHPDSGLTLHMTGREGVRMLAKSVEGSEDIVRMVARKGSRGTAWLRSGNYRLIRPHVIIGLVKGFWKGNIPALVEQMVKWLDAMSWLFGAALGLWCFVEASILYRRLSVLVSQDPIRKKTHCAA